MRILVVGSGGREHALCWKLAQEAEVICAPGNAGIAEEVECVNIPTNDFHSLLNLIKAREIDLVMVGPEDPLVAGLADAVREAGILCFGPGRAGAQLEGSKAFCKAMMQRAGVPTAEYQVFVDAEAAKAYAKTKYTTGSKLAIKASGNALGKGVIVAETLAEAEEGIDALKALGEAGKTLVLEEKLEGKEFSLLTITNGIEIYSLPVAQDYKRIHDQDQGPNTGGMGTFSPVDWVTAEIIEQTERETVLPILQTLREDGIEYRGVLFSGLMQTAKGPMCLEYNVRFGDPETQSVLSRLGNGFAEALRACASGEPIPSIEILNNAAVTVVAASAGYPGDYEKGKVITINPLLENVKVFHAGTKLESGELKTSGGRVLAATATAPTQQEARAKAYEALAMIHFDGMQARTDIGA
ncbi:MAG: phosphoribosylamine--glycine ligase [Armatimonadota bacterium]